MVLTVSNEDTQRELLTAYNNTLPKDGRIPLIPRNVDTGWPLLQVSFLSPSMRVQGEYEPALGGGKCHSFHVEAFNFSALLTKISGPIEIIGDHGQKIDKKNFSIDSVHKFMKTFHMQHKGIGFMIDSNAGGYGRSLTIEQCPAGDADKFAVCLERCADFAYRLGCELPLIGPWDRGLNIPSYTEADIISRINPDVAVVVGGQVFIDLGKFLQQKVQDEELMDYLQTIFKVDEFLAFKAANLGGNLISQAIAPSQTVAQVSAVKEYSCPATLDKALAVLEEKSANLQVRGYKLIADTVRGIVDQVKHEYQNYCQNNVKATTPLEKLALLNSFKKNMLDLIFQHYPALNKHRDKASNLLQSMGLFKKDGDKNTDTIKRLDQVVKAIFELEVEPINAQDQNTTVPSPGMK